MSTHFYTDWNFWAFFVAGWALFLSQVRPVRTWLRKTTLDVEVYNKILLHHNVGSPLAQLHILLRNNGANAIQIRSIALVVQRDDEVVLTLPAQGYFQTPADRDAILLTTFSLAPDGEWGHIINFFPVLPRVEDRQVRQLSSTLKSDILSKREALIDKTIVVAADDKFVAPLVERALAKMPWVAGDYTFTVRLTTSPTASIAEKKYRAVVFESDTHELKNHTESYKFGYGVVMYTPEVSGISIPLSEQ